MNFYDIILDFMIMDSMEDLEHPPSSVMSAIQNRWLSTRIKETVTIIHIIVFQYCNKSCPYSCLQ